MVRVTTYVPGEPKSWSTTGLPPVFAVPSLNFHAYVVIACPGEELAEPLNVKLRTPVLGDTEKSTTNPLAGFTNVGNAMKMLTLLAEKAEP